MRTRVPIYLDAPTYAALKTLAEREFRDPRSQAAFMLRRELQRVGLLPADSQTAQAAEVKPEEVRHAEPQAA